MKTKQLILAASRSGRRRSRTRALLTGCRPHTPAITENYIGNQPHHDCHETHRGLGTAGRRRLYRVRPFIAWLHLPGRNAARSLKEHQRGSRALPRSRNARTHRIHRRESGRRGMRLPVLSGLELIKRLKKAGFVATRQRGSHVRLEWSTGEKRSN